MILHWRIRTESDWWFSKIFRIRIGSDSILSGLDSDWKISQSAHLWWALVSDSPESFLSSQSHKPFESEPRQNHLKILRVE